MFRRSKVGQNFLQTPMTHITIEYSGKGGTKGLLLVTNFSEIEKHSGFCL